MVSIELLTRYFGINYGVVCRQIEGITHKESLLQPPFKGNCLNWVVGHIVASRHSVLEILGQDPIWSEKELILYQRESDAIIDGTKAIEFERIIEALHQTQGQITDALEDLSPEDLQQVHGEQTVGERLAFLYWHEGYHTGQTELLRQLAGKNDKII